MKTITYEEYMKTSPNVSLEDIIELQTQGEVMVTVNEMLYVVTDIDLNEETTFMCIDKECEEYTFNLTDIQKIEVV